LITSNDAPANVTSDSVEDHAAESPMGLLPHQIRGFLGSFSNILISGHAYDRCTACSPTILSAYRANSLEFVAKALRDPKYLEDLTGLSQMKSEADDLGDDWDVDEDEDDL
jgi:ubiquitin-like modifier-activating enzyme ATG7